MATFDLIDIGINNKQALKDINTLAKKLDDVVKQNYELLVTVLDKQANKSINNIISNLNKINDTDININVEDKAIKPIKSIQSALDLLTGKQYQIQIDTSDIKGIDAYENKINELAKKELKVSAEIDKSGLAILDDYFNKIKRIDNSKINIDTDINEEALGKISNIETAINTLSDINIDIDADINKALNNINTLEAEGEGLKDIEVVFTADNSKALQIIKEVESYTNKSYVFNIDADISGALTAISKLNSDVQNIRNADIDINISKSGLNILKRYEDELSSIAGKTYKIGFDIGKITQISDYQTEISSLDNSIIDIEVDVDKGGLSILSEYEGYIERLDNSIIDIKTSVNDAAIKQINSIQSEIKSIDNVKVNIDADTSKASSEFNSFIKEAESKSEGLSSTLKAGIAGAVAVGAAAALGNIVNSVGEISDKMAGLQARTGATDEQMKALKDTAFDVFERGVGDSLDSAIDAIGIANQQLGNFLDVKGIESFVVKAGGIAKVFDKDINEVITNSRTFIANFGLEGEEAANLISLGLQKAGNQADDFLDTLSEYSPLMEGAGLSAERFTGILIEGIQNGARDTDKLADAIKEAQVRLEAGDYTAPLKDLIASTSGAERELTQSLLNIADQAKAGNISIIDALSISASQVKEALDSGAISASVASELNVAFAGVPAEDIGRDVYLRTFSADLPEGEIIAKATAAGDLIDESLRPKGFEGLSRTLEATFADLALKLEPVFTKLSEILIQYKPQFEAIVQIIANTLIPALDFLASNLDIIAPLVGVVALAFGGWAAITGKLVIAQTKLSVALTANPIGIIVVAVAALVAGIVLAYRKSDTFRKIVDKLWESLKSVWDIIWNFLKPAVMFVINLFKLYINIYWDIIKLIGRFLLPIFKSLYDSFISITKVVFEFAKKGLTFLYKAFEPVINILKDVLGWLGKLFGGLMDFFKGFNEKVESPLRDVKEDAEQTTESLAKGADNAKDLRNALDGTADGAEGVSDSFVDANGNVNDFSGGVDNASDSLSAFEKKTKQVNDSLKGVTDILNNMNFEGISKGTEAYSELINDAADLYNEQLKLKKAVDDVKESIEKLALQKRLENRIIEIDISVNTIDGEIILDDFYDKYSGGRELISNVSVQGVEDSKNELEEYASYVDIISNNIAEAFDVIKNIFGSGEENGLEININYEELDKSISVFEAFRNSWYETGVLFNEISDIMIDSAGAIGESIGALAVTGELSLNNLKDTFSIVLDAIVAATYDWLQKQALIWSAAIFGQEVSKLGFAGIATAGIITGILMGLINSARASIGAEDGGYITNTYNKKPGKTDTIPAMLAPNEYVVNAKSAKKNLELLNAINSGKDINNIVRGQNNNITYVNNLDDRNIVNSIKGLESRLSNIERATYEASGRYQNNTSIRAEFGNVKLRGSDIDIAVNKYRKNKVRLS